jgi:hypothetical protein
VELDRASRQNYLLAKTVQRRAGMQRGECVDAAVERLVSYAARLEPLADGMAGHEARAHLPDRELVEVFLLIAGRKMQ